MILHITNDYSGSTVYMNLVRELDNLKIAQIIYNPIRDEKLIRKNAVEFNIESSEIIYRPILNYHIDRILYPWKIKKILKDIQNQVDFSNITFIHAHTWYSDGGVAYELSKKYNIPYIVTIRNTDINLFQQKLKYLRPYGRKVLERAEKVILISASYKNRILSQNSLAPILPALTQKLEIIPNGVDPFWIENIRLQHLKNNDIYNLIYIGNFNVGKNILNLVNAVIQINESDKICTLTLVGGSGVDEAKILEKVDKYPDIFSYHGKIYDKNELLKVVRSTDVFAMPSRNETFGLVYVEAMLQGLPILYTADEGIDGFYNEPIGEKVGKQSDELEIRNALLKMFENYSTYQIPTDKLIINHDWSLIARKYIEFY